MPVRHGPPAQEIERLQRRVIDLEQGVGWQAAALASAGEHMLNLQLIVDNIPGLVAVFTASGALEAVNNQILEYFGATQNELQGWAAGGYIHPEDVQRTVDAFTESVSHGVPFGVEVRARRYDGAYRWFEIRGRPSRDAEGRIVRWYGLLTDIDDRKRAEEALLRSEEFLVEGQRLSSTGTFLWYVDTGEMTFSQELYRIHEIDPKLPMDSALHMSRTHPDDVPLIYSTARRFIHEGGPITYESRLRMPDGRIKYVRTFGRLIHDRDGRPACLGVCQDMTERRLAELALDEVRSELAHAARVMTLGALAASIAHEVNQPLSGIVTNASTCLRLLAAHPPNVDGAMETARRTIRDGNRASDVVGRLRTLFSKKTVRSEEVDLNDAAREVIALASSGLQRNRVVIRTDLADDLQRIAADRVQLQQVILNLVLNASDAMCDVEDRQRLLVIKTAHDGEGQVRLSVRDAGLGFPIGDVERLFGAFYTTKSSGMGIGLSVSRSIIESHGGRLWGECNDGPGATFSFSIPETAVLIEGSAPA